MPEPTLQDLAERLALLEQKNAALEKLLNQKLVLARGPKGEDGRDGKDGKDGRDGKYFRDKAAPGEGVPAINVHNTPPRPCAWKLHVDADGATIAEPMGLAP